MYDESKIDIFELARSYSGYGMAAKRLFATLVDIAVLVLAGMSYAIVLAHFNLQFLSAFLLCLLIPYQIVLETYWGQTLGKLLFGLIVVRENGGNPTLAQATFRFISKLFVFIPPAGIGSLFRIVNSPYHQRNGDLITRTFVVKSKDLCSKPAPMTARTQVEIHPIDLGPREKDEIHFEILDIKGDVRARKRFRRSAWSGRIVALIMFLTIMPEVKTSSILVVIAISAVVFFSFLTWYAALGKQAAHIIITATTVVFIGWELVKTIVETVQERSSENYEILALFVFVFLLIVYFPIIGWIESARKSEEFVSYDRYNWLDRIQNFIRKGKLYLTGHTWPRKVRSLGLLLVAISLIFSTIVWITKGLVDSLSVYIESNGESRTTSRYSFEIFLLLIFIISQLVAKAKRYLQASVAKLRKYDARPPILYIRSFKDDLIRIEKGGLWPNLYRTTLEEVIDHHMSIYGPVIAIGQPGEKLPPLGVTRHYVIEGESWQDLIETYIKEARLIVTVLSNTQGLNWEYQKASQLGALSKMIIVIPPLREDEVKKRWAALMAYFPVLQDLPECVEGDLSKVMALRFTVDKQCRVITFSESVAGFREAYFREKEYRMALTRLVSY